MEAAVGPPGYRTANTMSLTNDRIWVSAIGSSIDLETLIKIRKGISIEPGWRFKTATAQVKPTPQVLQFLVDGTRSVAVTLMLYMFLSHAKTDPSGRQRPPGMEQMEQLGPDQ